MKLQNVKKVVQSLWTNFHSHLGPAENRDLAEYEKVKREFKPIYKEKGKKAERSENRDISAI